MANGYSIFVGTVGQGLNISSDSGESWTKIRNPIPTEGNVRALQAYPGDAHRILAGSDGLGLFRSDDNGLNWESIEAPTGDLQVWSVGIDPSNTNTIFAGTRPEGFRSRDGGKSWDKLSMGVNMECPIGTPRTTNIIVDPRDSRTVWAGIEVDGVYKSLDGGDNWVHLPDLGPDPFQGDIHGMALRTTGDPAVYCTSPFGIASSNDEGESWDYHYFPKFNENDARSYCRGNADQGRQPRHDVRGQRRFHSRRHRRDPSDQGRRRDLGLGQSAGGTELGGLLAGQQPRDAERSDRSQSVRLRLRQRGRRRHLDQAEERIRRNPRPGGNPQLTRNPSRRLEQGQALCLPLSASTPQRLRECWASQPKTR